ncbi:MAG: DUF6168 family protein [Maribacter sp.]|nr:DUF6168 family protein [Maribacter sp.]
MTAAVRPILNFTLVLFGILGLAFLAHSTLLDKFGFPPFGNKIVLSYLINAVLALIIYSSLFVFRNRLKNYIGFLFMGGSFLKFIFFFLLFYPGYSADGVMDKMEFAGFFVPYAISLVIETVFTAQMLKNLV